MIGEFNILNCHARPIVDEKRSSRTQSTPTTRRPGAARTARRPPARQRQFADRNGSALHEENPVRVVAVHRDRRRPQSGDAQVAVNDWQRRGQGDRSGQTALKSDRVCTRRRVRIDNGLPQRPRPRVV